jgi:peptidoglycan/LPS O-acetylase OafA/YrhL
VTGQAIFWQTDLEKVAPNKAITRLAFADGLRGLAALWVVLFHLSEGRHIDSLKAALPSWLSIVIFEAGHLGVAVFFALSGFVMALTLPNGLNDLSEAFRFMVRRLVRLTPPYYLAIAFALAMIFLKLTVTGVAAAWLSGGVIIANMFYLQGLLSVKNIDSVFWTLCIELQFYLVFAILLWIIAKLALVHRILNRQVLLQFAAWVSLAFVEGPTALDLGVPGLFLPFWYSFMAGLMACHGWKQAGWVRASAVAFILSVVALAWVQHSVFMAAVGVSAASLLVVGLMGEMSRGLNWAPLQSLALCSYSLYLLHNPITGASVNLLRRFVLAGVWSDVLVGLGSVGLCLVMARFAYRWVEVPSMNRSKRWA